MFVVGRSGMFFRAMLGVLAIAVFGMRRVVGMGRVFVRLLFGRKLVMRRLVVNLRDGRSFHGSRRGLDRCGNRRHRLGFGR